jgi:hypothetical protein
VTPLAGCTTRDGASRGARVSCAARWSLTRPSDRAPPSAVR